MACAHPSHSQFPLSIRAQQSLGVGSNSLFAALIGSTINISITELPP